MYMLPMDGWKGVGWPVPIVNWFVRDARVWDDIDVYFRDLPSSSSNQQFESLLLGNALATKRSSCTGSQYQKQPPNEPPSNSHQLGSGNFCIPACEDLFQDNCQSDACQRNIRQKEPTSITVNPSVQTGAEQADDSFFKEKGSYPDSASPNYLNEDVSNNSRPGHLSANEVFCVGRRRQAIQQRKLRRKALQSERLTFKIEIAYYGPGFQGWKWQKDVRDSIEEVLVEALATVNSKGESVGRKAVVAVAGRTDKGVHAHRQVISFYTWDADVTPEHVVEAISAARPGLLQARHAERVPRAFHATFQATWRRYLYLFPLTLNGSSPPSTDSRGRPSSVSEAPATAQVCHPHPVEASRVHRLLQPLVGRDLDFYAMARDTPRGKDCFCRLLLARVWHCYLQGSDRGGAAAAPVLAVELVGTRFLRRMVRVLVATAIREAVPQASWFPGRGLAAAGDAQCSREAMLSACSSLHDPRLAAPAGPSLASELCGLGTRDTAYSHVPQACFQESAPQCTCGLHEGRAWPGADPSMKACAGNEVSCRGSSGKEVAPLNVCSSDKVAPLNECALLDVLGTMDRLQSAPPAPAVGLCFVEAGYDQWREHHPTV